jgi:hypothetical protein
MSWNCVYPSGVHLRDFTPVLWTIACPFFYIVYNLLSVLLIILFSTLPTLSLESIPVFGRRKTVPVSLLEHVLLLTLNILLYVTFLNVYYIIT